MKILKNRITIELQGHEFITSTIEFVFSIQILSTLKYLRGDQWDRD